LLYIRLSLRILAASLTEAPRLVLLLPASPPRIRFPSLCVRGGACFFSRVVSVCCSCWVFFFFRVLFMSFFFYFCVCCLSFFSPILLLQGALKTDAPLHHPRRFLNDPSPHSLSGRPRHSPRALIRLGDVVFSR